MAWSKPDLFKPFQTHLQSAHLNQRPLKNKIEQRSRLGHRVVHEAQTFQVHQLGHGFQVNKPWELNIWSIEMFRTFWVKIPTVCGKMWRNPKLSEENMEKSNFLREDMRESSN